jgi:hypothetical protein
MGTDLRMNLTIHNGVLLVSGFSGHAVLQPQSANLAFPFSIGSTDVYAMQARETNGIEILHYGGLNYRAIEDMPDLPLETTVTGTLAAGESAFYSLDISAPVYHNLYISPALEYSLFTVPEWSAATELSVTGQYVLAIHASSNTSYSVRLYNLTNTIAQVSTLITNLMAEYNLVGCGISLVDGDQVVMADGFGYADRENQIAADENTAFMIGSSRKPSAPSLPCSLLKKGCLISMRPSPMRCRTSPSISGSRTTSSPRARS